MLGLLDYLGRLAGARSNAGSKVGRDSVERAFESIAEYEERLSERLLSFLVTKPRVRVIGSTRADRAVRVPIISFVVDGVASSEVVSRIDEHQIGVRYGHFYSTRLIDALGLPGDDGVVRVSMAHYNTVDEIDRLTTLLDPLT